MCFSVFLETVHDIFNAVIQHPHDLVRGNLLRQLHALVHPLRNQAHNDIGIKLHNKLKILSVDLAILRNDLREAAGKYKSSLTMVYDKYKEIFAIVSDTVNVNNKIYWKNFTQAEKTATQNSVMLVALLYKMCQVKLVKTSEEKGKENTVNHEEINGAIVDSYKVMAKVS